ncbi:hypothetical protein [Nguyenibacter sp. L1]|uniref:hypothetical protein n=1 Tax=Nguyenibacter sp. L1 TaxID=3049350 RepID=UPI002B483171|nr:hypothetical protein [Nguyenibacter sp. L1]WRH89657.1 hypothetical protein QN315_08710 [Nguyenibacter sp. L1]
MSSAQLKAIPVAHPSFQDQDFQDRDFRNQDLQPYRARLPTTDFGTFWYGGRLSALEHACAASFVFRGYALTLFSYQPVENVPDGVTVANAADVLPEEMTRRFLHNGRPALGHFSDLFRYVMIRQYGMAWVDLDVLMLSNRIAYTLPDIVAREEQGGINGAILYLRDAAMLQSLIAGAEAMADRNLRWGETGPLLLGKLTKAYPETLRPAAANIFYPIEHYDIQKVLLPEWRDACAAKCGQAITLHLFNNILTGMGYWKDMAPPEGSFLYEALAADGALGLFRDIYPVTVMRNMVRNYQFGLNGAALGIRSIVRQAFPSVLRTYRHYYPR